MLSSLLGHSAWLASCLPDALAFRAALSRPERTQRGILKTLLDRNADSSYGRLHSFEKLSTAADFQSAVPVATHESLAPWIERIKAGEPRVLSAEPVLMLEKTSGSASAAKYIPYTAGLRREFQRAVRAWIFDLYSRRPALCAGRAYWCVTPLSRRRERSAGGLPVGFESDSEYLGGFEQRLLDRLLAVPPAAARVPRLDDGLYVTLRFLLQTPDLAFLSVWSPSFLDILLERLHREAERLLRDLAEGALSPPGGLPEDVRAALAPRLTGDPRRARALAAALRREGRLSPSLMWPRLRVISCWTDASARHGVGGVERAFPGVEIQGKGLLSTEGVVSIPLTGRGRALAVTSHFYEFVPARGGRPKLAHELEMGGEYGVLLSTGGGLWRYELGDVVRVTGFEKGTPLLEFLGRKDSVSDLCGEKLNSLFVGRALDDLKARGLWNGPFAMLAPLSGHRPRYGLFIEGAAAGALGERLDAALRENPHYDYARRLGQLGAPQIFKIERAAQEGYLRRCERLGQRAGGVKPTPLHARAGWESTFIGAFSAATKPEVNV